MLDNKAVPTARLTVDDVDVIAREPCYQGYFRIDAYRLRHRRFDGEWSDERRLELFERGHGVAVLPYDPVTNQVVLIEQFRVGALHSHQPWLLEIVAGVVEQGEAHDAVARREACEEANCTITELEPVCCFYVSPGGASESTRLYCGRVDSSAISSDSAGLAEEGEDIRVHIVDVDKAFAAVAGGEICTAPAIITLQWLQLNRDRLRRKWLER